MNIVYVHGVGVAHNNIVIITNHRVNFKKKIQQLSCGLRRCYAGIRITHAK
jgi:hypothetical protein